MAKHIVAFTDGQVTTASIRDAKAAVRHRFGVDRVFSLEGVSDTWCGHDCESISVFVSPAAHAAAKKTIDACSGLISEDARIYRVK